MAVVHSAPSIPAGWVLGQLPHVNEGQVEV